jgi:hypothetical protein
VLYLSEVAEASGATDSSEPTHRPTPEERVFIVVRLHWTEVLFVPLL